jgi:hypothetical protein
MDISGLPSTEYDQLQYFLKTSGGKLVPRNTKLNLYSLSATILCARHHTRHGGVRLGFHGNAS